ncbi:hypothetical protein SMC26_44070 [Actinomadura fulvescens]|uniref:Serine/threonine protein kinase n=1 Tax=Actinomadura fulvescens TaxID=46160 RepID=A0ABN3PLL2_9ACTN
MSRPLPPGDPVQLGPYRLSARLSETAAGIVFLGEDHEGRRASVAVLTRGAAGDAAARDRFRAAITAALPGPGRPPEFGPEGPEPVMAAQPDGPAPWVAVRYDADRPDRVGAERFLDSVMLEGAFRSRWGGGRRRGPQFQPYWLGSGAPALERPPGPPPAVAVPVERTERGLVSAILTLAAVLVVLALLMLVLFACQPTVKDLPPPPPEPTLQTPTPSPPPTTEAPSPSPSPTRPTPSPGESDDGGGPV